MYIERLEFGRDLMYNPSESVIHFARYMIAKQICKGRRVLDVACGEGYGSYLMAKEWGASEVHGVDISEEAIHKAGLNFEAPNIHFHAKDVSDLLQLFEENSFDVIISFETIEHLINPELFLENIKKLIKSDGSIIISCPNDNWYYPSADQSNPFHVKKYSFQQFVNLCESKLGMAKDYFLGLPSDGFANIKMNSSLINTSARNMMSFLEYQTTEAVLLPSMEYLDAAVTSYFVGVWTSSSFELNSTLSLNVTSMGNSRISDYQAITSLREHIDNLTKNEEDLLEEKRRFYQEREEKDKLIDQLALYESANGDFLNQLKELNQQINKLNERNLELEKNIKKSALAVKGTNKENEFLRHNLWLLQNRIEPLQNEVQRLQNELNSFFQSKSWKITAPLRRLFQIFK